MITKDGIEMLRHFAPSCSMASLIVPVAKTLEEGESIEKFRSIHSVAKLMELAEKKDQDIDGRLIIEYFCGREHYEDIKANGSDVAAEIPQDFISLLHTGLPLTDGVYQNSDVHLGFSGLLTIGKAGKGGFWIAHLAAKFWVPYGEELKWWLEEEQARIPGFLETAERIGKFDYSTCPSLRAETKKAIDKLQN
jgi:hypothetical protein